MKKTFLAHDLRQRTPVSFLHINKRLFPFDWIRQIFVRFKEHEVKLGTAKYGEKKHQ